MPDANEENKPYWHCLWPLSPPPSPSDHAKVKPLAAVKMVSEHGWNWHVFLLGRDSIIDVLGASVPAHFVQAGDAYQELLGRALNRAFSAASLVYSHEIELINIGDEQAISLGMFSDDEIPQSYSIEIGMLGSNASNWDLKSLLTFVAHDAIPADVLSALSEATRFCIPRQYRFLALCRALELLIPADRERSEWLEAYESQFKGLSIDGKRFRNYIPQLRARCAHGSVGQERAIFGVVRSGISTDVFNLLMKAVCDKLSIVAGIKIAAPQLSNSAIQALPAGSHP